MIKILLSATATGVKSGRNVVFSGGYKRFGGRK